MINSSSNLLFAQVFSSGMYLLSHLLFLLCRYYLSKLTMGVRAVRKVTFQFDSEETKKRIEATIKVKVGIGFLSGTFTKEYKEPTEDKRKDVAIEVAFANLGGNHDHLKLVDADFGENYENVEERLRSSWAAFMDDPSNLKGAFR